MRFGRFILFLICFGSTISPTLASDKPQLWLYYPTNFLVEKNIDKAQEIWTRAAAAGYTHVLIADSKFARLGQMDSRYFKNCSRAKQIATDLKLQLVPAVFSIGYSNDLLANDPNLAEGVPVKDQPFVVRNGVAELAPDPAIHFGKIAFHDPNVTINQGVASVAAAKGVSRFVYAMKVSPFRCYHVSVKIKTENLSGHPQIQALAKDQTLQWQNLSVKPTQDWTQYDVVFDSLDHAQLNVYFGIWSEVKGRMQWKDWSIEEVGLLNVLRRPGARVL